MKRCCSCKVEKDFSLFHKSRSNDDGYKPACKECRKIESTKRYAKHSESIKEYTQNYRNDNPKKNQEYYQENQEYFINYREANLEHHREWRKINRKNINTRRKIYLDNNPSAKIAARCRSRVSEAIKQQSATKYKNCVDLLGCSFEELKTHLESQFTKGMTWENYGKWHIDHIKPCKSFNLTENSEQIKCFHFSNLQPLWAIDNIKKGCKIP